MLTSLILSSLAGYPLDGRLHAFSAALEQTSAVYATELSTSRAIPVEFLDRSPIPNSAIRQDKFKEFAEPVVTACHSGAELLPGTTYLVGVGPAPMSRVLALPLFAMSNHYTQIRAEKSWRGGLFCWSIGDGKLTRAALAARDTGRRRIARVAVAGLGDLLISAKTEASMHEACSLIERWQISEWEDSGYFDEGGAWLDRWGDQILAATAKRDARLQVQLLGVCSLLPGVESIEKRFSLLTQLAQRGQWPAYLDLGELSLIGSDRLVRAANKFPKRREFFFNSVGTAPDEAGIRMIVDWLDGSKPRFAWTLLKKLAYWAQRPDLEPKVSHYVDGEPVIANREELTRRWRQDPPSSVRKHRPE